MEWYVPITILPGVGMLILSTTTQMMSLSTEIGRLLENCESDFQHHIADLKIKQLTKLTSAATLFYIAAALFVLSGIWEAFLSSYANGNWFLFTGVALSFMALGILIIYSFNTILIRKKQHNHLH